MIHSVVKSSPVKRLVGAAFVLSLAFVAITGIALKSLHHSIYDNELSRSEKIAAVLAGEIGHTVASLDLSLLGVRDNLRLSNITHLDDAEMSALIFDRSAALPQYGSMLLLDRNGRVKLSSGSRRPRESDYSGRAAFQIHKTTNSEKLFISDPYISRGGNWVIAVSRAIRTPSGEFDGAVLGTIRLSSFKSLFEKIGRTGDVITLRSPEGVIVMRSPFDESTIGRKVGNAQVIEGIANSPKGSFENVSVLDGVRRLLSYQHVEEFPLVVSVAHSLDDVFANFWYYTYLVCAGLIILCALNLMLVRNLAFALRRSNMAEAQLSRLARTDALTKLSNRRNFDESLNQEWLRMQREGRPVSLLMIDADHFKAFNDLHGHQAGDEVLARIGDCIKSTLKRPGDVGARYGGEEFAVLLPGEHTEGALAVAQEFRDKLDSVNRQQHGHSHALPTVSIGIASIVPRADSTPFDLVRSADKALYRAKSNGRDQFAFGATHGRADLSIVA